MAEKPPLENSGNVLDTNELFNMAKAATNARREKRRISIPQKEIAGPAVTGKSDKISEEENNDPENVDISEEENGDFTNLFGGYFFILCNFTNFLPFF